MLTERILQYKINNPKKTVGVIVAQNASVSRVESIAGNLIREVGTRNLNINIQYYVSKPMRLPAKELNFEVDIYSERVIFLKKLG